MPGRPETLEEAFALARAGRRAEGLDLLERLAEQGNADALFYLAETSWVGGHDFARGRALFEQAGEAGHALARATATNLLASGTAGARDWPAALARLAEEARSDRARARALALVTAMELDAAGDPRALPAGERLSERPRVTLFRGAVTAAECDYLLALRAQDFRRARVADGRGGERHDPVRTADQATLHWLLEDPAVHALNRRLAALSGTAPEQGEALQLLRYAPGQEYRPHMDWLDDGNPRVRTALIYLSEDYAGGETLFVKTGLKVKGARGDVLLFHNDLPDGQPDVMAEHAGLPVTSGTKFIASRWIHARRYAP